MKRFILAGAFAMTCAAPAVAVEFSVGDRGCLGYDAASHSCMSIQEVMAVTESRVTVADRTVLKLGRQPLTMVSRGALMREAEGYCVDPAASEYTAEPKNHIFATAMPNMVRTQMTALGGLGHCVKHRACGESLIVDSYVGGVERPAMRQVFRIFRKGDPKAATLTGRETTVAQMARLGGMVPAGCKAGAI